MIDVVNIVFWPMLWINYLTIKFLMLWMWTVNSSDVVWIFLWMSYIYITVNSKFEKYIGFIANSNNIFWICIWLSCVGRPKVADTNNVLDIGQVGHLY
jgi:hypothetical protein